jgi:fatty-acid desaturase
MKLVTFKNVVLFPGFLLGSTCLVWSLMDGLQWYVLGLWSMISGLGIAVGFHRVYSHRTHTPRAWLDNLLLFFGSLAGQGSSITWVAVHRGYHHRHTDTIRDLHSPVHGIWHSFLGWYGTLNETTINHKYAVDLLRKKNHVWVHKNYLVIHMSVMAVLLWISLLANIPVFPVYMGCLFISLVQDNAVNTLCHIRKMGYKNGSGADNSVNVPILGYLTFGQAHHENHHVRPAKFNFGLKWWEVDPAMLFLPIIKIGSFNERPKPTNDKRDVSQSVLESDH